MMVSETQKNRKLRQDASQYWQAVEKEQKSSRKTVLMAVLPLVFGIFSVIPLLNTSKYFRPPPSCHGLCLGTKVSYGIEIFVMGNLGLLLLFLGFMLAGLSLIRMFLAPGKVISPKKRLLIITLSIITFLADAGAFILLTKSYYNL